MRKLKLFLMAAVCGFMLGGSPAFGAETSPMPRRESAKIVFEQLPVPAAGKIEFTTMPAPGSAKAKTFKRASDKQTQSPDRAAPRR